jgi:hypothetical protein
VTDLFYWCGSCGRVSILAEVARFGLRVAPYICPGCAIEQDGRIVIPPDKNKLIPSAQARQRHPNFPEVPTRGETYR